MKTISITLSDELADKLRMNISSGKISKFISYAIEEKLNIKEQELQNAYYSAENDRDRKQEIEEWEKADVKDW